MKAEKKQVISMLSDARREPMAETIALRVTGETARKLREWSDAAGVTRSVAARRLIEWAIDSMRGAK